MSSGLRDDFNKGVKGLDSYVSLIVPNAQKFQTSAAEILGLLLKGKTPGIYVTLNKPYDVILRSVNKFKIDARLVIFIDGITNRTMNQKAKIQNCLFIGSPEKLSDLFVALDQAVAAIPMNDKFIIFDSVNTLSLFNAENIVARFIHQLVGKMRAWKVKGIVFSLQKDSDKVLLDELTPFCDLRLDIN